jgi:hypothetical protein
MKSSIASPCYQKKRLQSNPKAKKMISSFLKESNRVNYEQTEVIVPLHWQLLPEPDGRRLGAGAEGRCDPGILGRDRDEIRKYVESLPESLTDTSI